MRSNSGHEFQAEVFRAHDRAQIVENIFRADDGRRRVRRKFGLVQRIYGRRVASVIADFDGGAMRVSDTEHVMEDGQPLDIRRLTKTDGFLPGRMSPTNLVFELFVRVRRNRCRGPSYTRPSTSISSPIRTRT